jgi:hypothetical protein
MAVEYQAFNASWSSCPFERAAATAPPGGDVLGWAQGSSHQEEGSP